MNNKTLRRILGKTLNAKSREEVAASLEGLAVRENLLECFDMLDAAITDLDRVIDIRDRSLAISSKELMTLNDQVSAEKTRFEECLRLYSAMTLKTLEIQLQESSAKVSGVPVRVQMYFASFFFAKSETVVYFSCNDRNEPVEHLKPAAQGEFQPISSAKGEGILAFARFDFEADNQSALSRIDPLLPHVAAALENIRLLQDTKVRQRMESELQTARFVQQALLPPSSPMIIAGGLEISGYYQNASECGGDWWSHIQLADGRHIVFVGDVTGHGTASAMVCAVVKGYCESFVTRAGLTPAKMMEELNRLVHQISGEAGRAMTMVAIEIEMEKHQITFCNAGHPPPILIKSAHDNGEKRKSQFLVSSGHILGLNPSATYNEKPFAFNPGDELVLYSDGVVEYVSRNRAVYGDHRLNRVLTSSNAKLSAAELNRAIIRDLRDFSLGQDPADDITMVVIKAKEMT